MAGTAPEMIGEALETVGAVPETAEMASGMVGAASKTVGTVPGTAGMAWGNGCDGVL